MYIRQIHTKSNLTVPGPRAAHATAWHTLFRILSSQTTDTVCSAEPSQPRTQQREQTVAAVTSGAGRRT